MKLPNWVKKYLNEEGADAVAAAVKRAELKTSGEIVPMIVHRSSTVGHIPLAITLLLTSLLLALELSIGSDWHFSGLLYWPIVLLVVFALSGFLAQLGFIERWFTPKEDQADQVLQRAELEFYRAGLRKTENSTGVLIFLSIAEHRAVVLADKAIAEKLPPDTWQGVIDTVIGSIKSGDLKSGLTQAIERCGEILAKDFPIKEGDTNELPNTLIIKE